MKNLRSLRLKSFGQLIGTIGGVQVVDDDEPQVPNRQGRIVSEVEGGYEIAKERAERTMARVDRMPQSIRALAHEYGWLAVSECISAGITKPRVIEHLITVIRDRDGSIPVCKRLTAEGVELLQAPHPSIVNR